MSKSESDSELSSASESDSDDEVDVQMSAAPSTAAASESEEESEASESEASESEEEEESDEEEDEESDSDEDMADAETPAPAPAAAPAPVAAPVAAAAAAPAKAPKAKRADKSVPSTQLLNKNIASLNPDFYYHLGLSSALDLKSMFGDVRFVLLSGSPVRAFETIGKVVTALNIQLPMGCTISPIGKTERYSVYKAGPVMSVSHGMGKPSISIMLHELTKLLAAAGVLDQVTYIRVGTSGGLGVPPGSVIVSSSTVNGALEPTFPVIILGKTVQRPCRIQPELVDAIMSVPIPAGHNYQMFKGITCATDDFYEGQGRLDGAICEYTIEDKMAFLRRAHAAGVRNIEMESDCIVAFCTKLNIRCAVICVTLLNRLNGDQVTATPAQLVQYADNAVMVAIRYIQSQLQLQAPAASKQQRAAKDLAFRPAGVTVPHVAGSSVEFPAAHEANQHTGHMSSDAAKKQQANLQQQAGESKKKKKQKAAAAAAPAPAAAAPATPAAGASKKKKNKQAAATPAAAAPATPAASKKKNKQAAAAAATPAKPQPTPSNKKAPKTPATPATPVANGASSKKKKDKKNAAAAAPATPAPAAAPATPAATPANGEKMNRRQRKAAAAEAAAAAKTAEEARVEAAIADLSASVAADRAKLNPDAVTPSKTRRPTKNERKALKEAAIKAAQEAGKPLPTTAEIAAAFDAHLANKPSSAPVAPATPAAAPAAAAPATEAKPKRKRQSEGGVEATQSEKKPKSKKAKKDE